MRKRWRRKSIITIWKKSFKPGGGEKKIPTHQESEKT